MIDKIKKFTVDDKNNLLSKTFYVLPDNPSDKHFSPSQIRKKGYEGYLVLFEFLNSVIDAINENVDLSNEDIETINANITTLQSYFFGDGIAKKAYADASGDIISVTYETKADSSSKQSAVLSLLNGLEASILDGTITSKKAERDANGNVINETYETKADASSKLANAKLYADGKVSDEATARASADADLEARKVNVTDIVDGLNDTSTNKPLSANMGKALKAMIDTITSILASDDTDLDTLQEIVAYVKDNKSLIDSITVTKVNVSDIIDNLTSEIANKPVSAKQAFILKGMIDALTAIVNTKANSADVYDKTATDAMLALKADAEDVYDKDEIDAKIHGMLFADIDEDFDLESENPVQNKVISKEIEDINYTIMVMKEELFETILSEIEYKVDFATIFAIPDTLSDDDGQHRVVYSDTQLKEVEGNSVAFNQLVQFSAGSSTRNGIHETRNSDKISGSFYTDAGGATAFTSFTLGGGWEAVSNHKYFCISNLAGGSNSTYGIQFAGTLDGSGKGIFLSNISGHKYSVLFVAEGCEILTPKSYCHQVFDLTHIFGAGNEPTTYEQVKAELLKRGVDIDEYNEYSAGEIRNTVIKGVKVNGYNLFDGELEIGYWYNDTFITNVPNHDGVGSKNYIKVIGGQKYTLEYNNANIPFSSVWTLNQYDADKNLIKSGSANKDTVLENNCCYVRFNQWASGQTDLRPYLSSLKVCFHLTGSRTGYAPYKEPHIIQIPETELLSAGSVHDTIKFVEGNIVEGEQRYNMVHVSRIGVTDLGTLNWSTYSYGFYSTSISNAIKKAVGWDDISNSLCLLYSTVNFGTVYNQTGDRCFAINDSGYVAIRDTSKSSSTAEQFKTAMSGVILNYEKKEYTETTLATDLTFEEVSAIIEQNGSIEALFENVPPNIKTALVVKKAVMEGE